jgi:hypothetical protein
VTARPTKLRFQKRNLVAMFVLIHFVDAAVAPAGSLQS